MTRAHIGSRIEDRIHGVAGSALAMRGWTERILPYVGYGSVDPVLEGCEPQTRPKTSGTSVWQGSRASREPDRRIPAGGSARVLARVVLAKQGQPDVPAAADESLITRGAGAFFSVPQIGELVEVTFGDATEVATTDRGGYIDLTLTGHNLMHGWHEAVLRCRGLEARAPMQIIGGQVRFGLISDIDDTVLNTLLPRPFIAAWNTFVVRETVRSEVPGMAALYRAVEERHPEMPVFYLSTGAWNTQPVLTRFLRRNGFPAGTMLLTDWGPTESSWFRSGPTHKRAALRRLAREFPQIKWMLVGDSGQHDPAIYEEFALSYPEHCAGIAIRQLTPAQQVLNHGHPLQLDDVAGRVPGVAWIEGATGYELHRELNKILDEG